MTATTANARVVVTGGAGFIGVHSVEALLASGSEVLVIDDLRHASYRPLPGTADVEVADVAEAAGRVQRYRELEADGDPPSRGAGWGQPLVA